ncbi:sensor histidine kinase [Pararhizobium sp. PWRC1-1]|uniref:sensor histidine kinase n=1 Tax=Pararhizobium sp. PWRC1-1 TaxID=2804566 RepID=UPI003CF697FF
MYDSGIGHRPSPRERFLEAIVQSAIDYAIISTDLDGLVTSWNEGACRILGWTADEMIGRPATLFFTLDDRERGIPQKEMTAALDKGRGNDERWHLRKDDTQFWASGEIMVLRDEDDIVVGFIKILRDRTEQREQADRQRLLMHELGHRMKNTLSVVQSIATQSLRNARSLEEAGQTLTARIAAYSKAHDLLLQKDWVSATLADIVNGAKVNIGLEDSDRIRASGPSIQLGPQVALSFSLVFHELLTNASKYGALSNDVGVIDLLWSTEEIDTEICLLARWQELGGPTIELPKRSGFGSKLIISSLRAFGEVDLEYAPGGLVLSVKMPLAKIEFRNELSEL